MTITQGNHVTPRKPLRLWPAVVVAVAQLLVMVVGPVVAPDIGYLGMLGGVVGAAAILVWWLFFSRALWSERIGAIVLMVVAVLATRQIVHESMAGAGQGMLMYILPAPFLALALVAWALVTRDLQDGVRRASLPAAIMLACAPFALIRTAGVSSTGSEFHLRWTPTPEERLLALANDEPVTPPAVPASAAEPPVTTAGEPSVAASGGPAQPPVTPSASKAAAPAPPSKIEPAAPVATEAAAAPATHAPLVRRAEWPGFRGPERDGVVRGVSINTDWSASPPVQMWRRPIGPGWSSFAVDGDLLYTQEQRGEDEVVSCYKVSTGEPVWRHRDGVRFYESNGGPGPRATPTVSNGRVYTFGATGTLNALDARNGRVLWSRNAATDTGRKIPEWGIASSPLVVDDMVIVAVSGTLAAYDLAAGKPRWVGPQHGGTYSSPQLVTLEGVPQVLLLSAPGVVSVSPADGKQLWEHTWEGGAIVQPAITADGGILINAMSMTGGMGTRRLAVAHGPDGWTVAERWTSNGLKPYYNDFVLHKGHAFGFDGNILSCINLEDGARKWKGGRYGNGQLVLLADQDVLMVLSEEGELALVSATTEHFKELARFPVLNAKTWNHPVLVGDVLLVRNGEEMAAFRLATVDRAKKETLSPILP
jgi:outer membrane protein assembly factor BamB